MAPSSTPCRGIERKSSESFRGENGFGHIGRVVENHALSQFVVAKVGEHELAVPAAKAKALKDGGYVGKTVVLGIRPEDIHDSQMFIEASPSAPMTSVVKVYELLGAEVFLYFDVAGTQVTARVGSGTELRSGDKASFTFDMSKIHIFDKETELTISN